MATSPARIAYLDGPRLRRSLVAACEYTQQMRGELNRINVFPVPDGDTGTNLALTVRAIADHLRKNEDRSVSLVANEAAQAAVLGARGNSGMMLSHFLLGFARAVGEQARIGTQEFSQALTAGVNSLYAALEKPVEGTILTVMRETAEAAEREGGTPDFVHLVDLLLTRAKESLARTPTLLPALKKAGVVDAGAKGFVSLLEGVLLYIEGDPLVALEAAPDFVGEGMGVAAGEAEYPTQEEQYRFCTEALVRGEDLPDSATVRAGLHDRGDSLIVIRSGDILKIHIHTDEPDEVFAWLKGFGSLVTHKAEDMRAQHAAVERAASGHITLARRPLAIVTDSAADVPEAVVRAHGIHVVPLILMDGDRAMRDGIDITADEFQDRMRVEGGALPTTSQPTPGAFLEAYRRAAEDGEEVLAVVLGSGLSGTLASAEAAASRFTDAPVHVVDSLGASLLTGLLVLKATELAERAVPPKEIVAELNRIRTRSGILLTVDRFDRLLASGRVGKGRAWLGGLLDVKPILSLDDVGKVVPIGKVRGREKVVPEMMRLLAERVPPGPEADGVRVRFGVVHVGRPEIVDEVSRHLRARYGDVEILGAPATPVLSTHVGIGAWALAWMRED
jgi:uncharacterized protein